MSPKGYAVGVVWISDMGRQKGFSPFRRSASGSAAVLQSLPPPWTLGSLRTGAQVLGVGGGGFAVRGKLCSAGMPPTGRGRGVGFMGGCKSGYRRFRKRG